METNTNNKKLKYLYSQLPYPGNNNHNQFFSKAVFPEIRNYKINRILEAGCGTGAVLLDIYKCFSSKEIVGLDFSSKSIEIAKNTFKEIKNVSIYEADLTKNIKNFGKFDFIHCQGVLHHTNNPQIALKNLAGAVNENGLIYIWVYFKVGRREILDIKEIMSFFNVKDINIRLSILKDILKLKENAKQNPKYKKFLRKKKNIIISLLKKILPIIEIYGFRKTFWNLSKKFIIKKIRPSSLNKQDNIGLADEYLNPQEYFYEFNEFIENLNNNSLEIVKIVDGISKDFNEFCGNLKVDRNIICLSKEKKNRLMELIDKPSGVGFLCKKIS